MKTNPLRLIVFLLAILFGVEVIEACSCARVGPCLQNANADAVFVAKVVSVVRKGNAAVHEVEIVRLFNGLENLDRIEIYTDQVSSCAFSMETGETYLIFASISQKSGLVTTGYCSGTKRLKDASKEIEFLNSLRTAEDGKGVLRGSVLEHDLKNKFVVKPWKPKDIASVVLENEFGQRFEKPIALDGSYSFENLTGGRYSISFLVPERLITSEETIGDYVFKAGSREFKEKVKIPGSGCEVRSFLSVMVNGVIMGKVLDANGKPLAKIPVTLFRYDDADDMPEENYKVWSEDSGTFVSKGMPSGRYLIGFGIDHSLYINSHFAGYLPTFYPNTLDKSKASFIRLKEAEVLKEVNLQFPPYLGKRKITGRVVQPDGKPASTAKVNAYAKRNGVERGDWVGELDVDIDGRFEFEAFEETEYILSAWIEGANRLGERQRTFSSECSLSKRNGNENVPKLVLKTGSGNCDAYKIK